ncbi:MAG: hypothetical protein IPG34_06980 [Rhodocyclaceae bacterium]|nr:hypothetical protein [Rhodocyclaceae bacterium]
MQRIVAGIMTLAQHERALAQTPEIYQPGCCPHCGIKIVWKHGCYYRKADLCHRGEASHNPVPILRYCCSVCKRTCSRLPECIAPRRWYNWLLQQLWLRAVLEAAASPPAPDGPSPAPRTVGRWADWLRERTGELRLALTSRFAELGRLGNDPEFWLGVFEGLGLSRAMAWCDGEMSVP